MKTNSNSTLLLKSITNSYSQIFFSDKLVFAIIVMLVSFFNVYAGLAGFISVVITNGIAYWLGFDKFKIAQGYYGFNSLLVGIGMGLYFAPGSIFYCLLIFSAILSLIISVSIEGIVGKYGLPNLSLPFVFSLWIVMIAAREFQSLGLDERTIYSLNDLYSIGGKQLVDIYEWMNTLVIAKSIKIYLFSLGAIIFQYNLLSGLLIAIGLLIYSRIAFTLSIIGFYTAYIFYVLIGVNISESGYSYIGFNYILTAIAIGGYFLIPSPKSYLWVILIIPVVSIVTISVGTLLNVYSLPAYSLPFNLVVLMFLFTLKFRIKGNNSLQEVYIQQNKPEKNLYSYKNSILRFSRGLGINIQLPFHGEWIVTQGHNGDITHKNEWKHALDFEIADENGKTFKNKGDYPEDYHCYGKNVIAPADGVVEEVIDDIQDNIIGEENREQNWGNTIIIKHDEYLYSKLSHLKPESIIVSTGEKVKQGQIVAVAGNSGRSPVPHLHFQLQSTPYIGSKTLNYPITSFIRKNGEVSLLSFEIPEKDDIVLNINPMSALKKAFNLIPGKMLRFSEDNNGEQIMHSWEAKVDIYSKTYLHCEKTNSLAYYRYNDRMLIFEHFEGDRNSLLYHFYLAAYKVQTGLYKGLIIEDHYPVNKLFNNSFLMILQDFVAPFHIFLKAKYKIVYDKIIEDFISTEILLKAESTAVLFGKTIKKINFEITINEDGLYKFVIQNNNIRREIICLRD